MARRAKTSREAAADKTLASALGQSLDQIADKIADKVAEKLASIVADRLADAFVADITPAVVDKVASKFADKIAAMTQDQPAEQSPVETSDETAKQLSTEGPDKMEDGPHDVSTEAVIWVAAESPSHSLEQPLGETADKMEAEPAVAEQASAEMAPKVEEEPEVAAKELPIPVQPTNRASASAAGGKRRSPEAEDPPPQKKARTVDEAAPRRNPKRAANEAAEHAAGHGARLPEDLLMEALRPLSAEEIEAWEGWVELESEPAFFNFIVKKLGVKGVTIKELLSLESWALGLLPKPVFGLVFLFQYTPQLDDDEEDSDDGAPVWFANQTTPNSCASVALLNIIMNAEHVELGEQLQAFKESTRELSSPLRGRRIGSNGFIRAAHNSFVRRMDMLEADLCLANEVEFAKPRRSKKPAAAGKGRKQGPAASAKGAKKNKAANAPSEEFGFHFIAYVPANGFVWELDGMRTNPHNVGPLESEDWTEVAAPRIQQRIQEYGNSANGFSLLAMCRSPLDVQRSAIASHMGAIHRLRSRFQEDASFADHINADEALGDVVDNEAALGEFDLQQADVADATVPEFLRERMSRPDLDAQQARGLYEQLVAGTKFAMVKYREEIIAVSEEEERVRQRQKDYTPALHHWMTKLANKGVLEDVIRTSQ